ncbi:hypothetical protein [Mucilaginibacter sp. FT3.2]|uniref:hypothetical protein n=1 Tax=Mucilaginibacter sp. FT3.2 TaxID=2723090 RepID=UPI00161E556C|nr:hypothetical protein [Mucilaginibacter sp. FT3.2]MBB6235173.1 hypothetical protein [Mucilaginibacter sp. FT3.2]
MADSLAAPGYPLILREALATLAGIHSYPLREPPVTTNSRMKTYIPELHIVYLA